MMINTTGGRNRLFESVSDDFGNEEQRQENSPYKQEEDFLYGLMTGKDL